MKLGPLPLPSSHAFSGFTLIEVLVALSIVAIALVAGVHATTALTNNALRQTDVLLAHLCAENELIKIRLSRQLPDIGELAVSCEQAGRILQLTRTVRPTPNPEFRRLEASVSDGGRPILQLATIATRY